MTLLTIYESRFFFFVKQEMVASSYMNDSEWINVLFSG